MVGAVLTRGDQILLGRRSPWKALCPDCWDLPGGHVETGEPPVQALRRELVEELGVSPTEPRAVLRERLPDGGEFTIFVVADWTGGEPTMVGDEHVELRWFAIDAACALPDLASPDYVALFRSLRPGA